MPMAIYDVRIGTFDSDGDVVDDSERRRVQAVDVAAALKAVRLKKGEYYSAVNLVARCD